MSKEVVTYIIEQSTLDKGINHFDFNVDDSLFHRYENREMLNSSIKVSVDIEKNSNQMLMKLKASGKGDLQCDRCLDNFTHNIDLNNEILIKLDNETNYDLDADYVTLNTEENKFDIAYFIYEMLVLGLPQKRVHPDDENGNPLCNPEVTKFIDGESELNENEGSDNPKNDDWKEDLKDLLN